MLATSPRTPVSETPDRQRNNLDLRLSFIEKRVDELEKGQPAVMAERVGRLSVDVVDLRKDMNDDMGALREEMRSMKRANMAVYSGLGIVIAGAVVSIILQGGGP